MNNISSQFLMNLSRVLAHTIVYEHNEPGCMGDPKAAGTQESTAEMLKAFITNYGPLSSEIISQILPMSEANMAAKEAISPRELELQTGLYEKYGPRINKAGTDTAAQNKAAQSVSDLALMQGTGKDLVTAQREAQMLADPEYFAARQQTADQLSRLYGSLEDPNAPLSGSARAEIDRSLARSNASRGLETPTSTSAVANALTFGQAGEANKLQKQQALAAGINTGTNYLPAARSNIDVGMTVFGRPTTANTGESRLGGVSETSQNQAFGLGGQMWNQLGQMRMQENDINSKRRDVMDRISQGVNMASSLIGAVAPG